jgi:hypothetical protein
MTIQDGETDGNGLNGWMLSEKKARRMDKSWGAGLLSCHGYLVDIQRSLLSNGYLMII